MRSLAYLRQSGLGKAGVTTLIQIDLFKPTNITRLGKLKLHESTNNGLFEKTIRGVINACADCDTCRIFMDESCLFFPELFRLYDKEKAEGEPVRVAELRELSELCTLCGLCPCPNVPADIIRGKTERAQMEGMPFNIRLLADVQRFGRWCGIMPGVVNTALAFAPIDRAVKKIAGIHPKRRLPEIARESFFVHGLKRKG